MKIFTGIPGLLAVCHHQTVPCWNLLAFIIILFSAAYLGFRFNRKTNRNFSSTKSTFDGDPILRSWDDARKELGEFTDRISVQVRLIASGLIAFSLSAILKLPQVFQKPEILFDLFIILAFAFLSLCLDYFHYLVATFKTQEIMLANPKPEAPRANPPGDQSSTPAWTLPDWVSGQTFQTLRFFFWMKQAALWVAIFEFALLVCYGFVKRCEILANYPLDKPAPVIASNIPTSWPAFPAITNFNSVTITNLTTNVIIPESLPIQTNFNYFTVTNQPPSETLNATPSSQTNIIIEKNLNILGIQIKTSPGKK